MGNPKGALHAYKKRPVMQAVFAALLAVLLFCPLLASCKAKEPVSPATAPPPPAAALELKDANVGGGLFDFAIRWRLDYIPLFEEGKAPEESPEYLYWAFAVNLYNWGEDKGIMTRDYVEEAVLSHFPLESLTHAPLRRGWDYDGEKYTAVPTGISDEPLYALQEFAAEEKGGKRIYTVTLARCAYPEYPPSQEDMANYRAAIAADHLSGFKITRTEIFRFYRNEQTGEPVFLSHTLPPAQIFYESSDEGKLKKIITDADFITVRRGGKGFADITELGMQEIFNLYASTEPVQSRMRAAKGDFIELSASEISAFFAAYFEGCPYDTDKLVAEMKNILRYKEENNKEVLLFSTINGGVFWPSPIPFELTVDSYGVQGDRLTLRATRRNTDTNDLLGEYSVIEMSVRVKEGGFSYASYSSGQKTDKPELIEKYYTYFAGHNRQVNPLFAFPGDNEKRLDENLMVFAFQSVENPNLPEGISRKEIDGILNKYFGRTVKNYITSYSSGLVTGNLAPSGWSFHGANRLVLTGLAREADGSLTGAFDVYYLPEGEEGIAAIDAALAKGETEKYQSYFSQRVSMNWAEIVDDSEPGGFYIRYKRIIPGKGQDWSIGKGAAPAYFFVRGSFMGGFDNGWLKLTENESRREYTSFLIKDLLNRGYALYSKEKYLGQAEEVLLHAGLGPSGWPDGDKTGLFAPYAKEEMGGSCILPLPTVLTGGEIEALTVPLYGFSLYMGKEVPLGEEFDVPDLATNAPITPPDGIVWAEGALQEDEKRLSSVLAENNVVYDRPAVTTATGDFDSDGKMERVLFANARSREDGYLDVSAENKTLFSVILTIDDDGGLQTAYARLFAYTDDVTAHFRAVPHGIFDLNGDGRAEICFRMIGWEGGNTFVLSQNAKGAWEEVLAASWGM